MSVFDGIDMSDPCAVWPKLDEVRNRLLAGEMVVETFFGSDRTRWQNSDLDALDRRISRLKAECAAKTTGRPVRHAIRAGFRGY